MQVSYITKVTTPQPVFSTPSKLLQLTAERAVMAFVDAQDAKPSTIELYTRTLRLFFNWVRSTGRNINTLARKDILEYRNSLQNGDKPLSSLTVASYLTSIRKFYQWADATGIYSNIVQNVRTPKREQAFKKMHLTDEQCAELLTHFETISLRNYAIVNLILRTGLRTIEVIRADVGDIDFEGTTRVLRVWGKGRDKADKQEDFVILTDKAFQPIREYLSTRTGLAAGQPLFTSDSRRNTGERLTTRSIRGLVKEGLKAIGLDSRNFTAHSLRHTTATTILKQGGTLEDVQNVLRHRNSDTTRIYVESIKKEMRLQHRPEALIDNAF